MHALLPLVIPAAVLALGWALKAVAPAFVVYSTSKAIVRVAALTNTGAEDAARSIAIALGSTTAAGSDTSGQDSGI